MAPQELISWVIEALGELEDSVASDGAAGRTFGWISRLRQVDELYMRCVYIVLIAPNDEIPHLFSGETPNGFDFIYERFNQVILGGRGILRQTQGGLQFGNFTPMKTVHNAAHVSFQSLFTWKAASQHPEHLAGFPEKYLKHIRTYRSYLTHLGALFATGREKIIILNALQNLHGSAR